METSEYIWQNGSFIRWEDAKVHVLTHALHYGSAVFEGIRAYKTERGAAIFRLPEHIDRLFYSAAAIKIKIPWSKEEIANFTVELLKRNKLEQGYIRPLAYYGYGKMGLKPMGAPVEVSLSCWKWGAYLPHEMVDIKTSSFIRIHPRSTVVDAKVSGHYVNSIMASLEIQDTKYHESLFLDADGRVAEGPGENIFFIQDGALFTPPPGSILAGITRDTIIQLAKASGYKVTEKHFRLEDAYRSSGAFYTGTAAEVTPIRSIDDKVLGDGKIHPICKDLKQKYQDVTHGRNKEFERFLRYV